MPKNLFIHFNVGAQFPLVDPVAKDAQGAYVRQQANIYFQGFKVSADWGDCLKLELTENQADVVHRRVTAGFRADVDHPKIKLELSMDGAPYVRYFRDPRGDITHAEVVTAYQLDCPRILITDKDSLEEDQMVHMVHQNVYITGKCEEN